MGKLYECTVQLGKGKSRSFFWVKSADWVDDSVVLSLSPDQHFIDPELARVAPTLLCCAQHRRMKNIYVTNHESIEPHVLDSSGVYPDLQEKYKSFIREYTRIYGFDALKEIMKTYGYVFAAPSDEVSGDA